MSKDVDIEIFNRMLDDPEFDPCMLSVEYTDKEVDGWRALWVLENQLKFDRLITYKPKITILKEKYGIDIPVNYLRLILRSDNEVRVKASSRGSLTKSLRLAEARDRRNMQRFFTIAKINLNLKGCKAKRELLKILRWYGDIGFKYSLSKSIDYKVQIALPLIESKNKSIRERKEIKELMEFSNYEEALKFMKGFSMGYTIGQYREVKRWENGIHYEMQRRKLNKDEGKI